MKKFLRKLRLVEDEGPLNENRRAEHEERNRVRPNARLSYPDHIANLLKKNDTGTAMSLAVGGDYEKMGQALRAGVERCGLKPNDYLIDVGCGSGRLAFALGHSTWRDSIRYLGIDVVPTMLEFAAQKCEQPRWRFDLVTEPKIPEADGVADMVCFFSVFTHLLQEESFLYLEEARRVLKPGGRIIATYLDMADARHWSIFENNVHSTRHRQQKPMDIFLSQDFFVTWASRLDLTIIDPHAPGGGQRICILQKP
jgi:SAM-dependent methyltransferase